MAIDPVTTKKAAAQLAVAKRSGEWSPYLKVFKIVPLIFSTCHRIITISLAHRMPDFSVLGILKYDDSLVAHFQVTLSVFKATDWQSSWATNYHQSRPIVGPVLEYASSSIIKLEHYQIFINSWHNLQNSNCVRDKNHQSASDVYEAQESRNLLHFFNAAIHVSSTVATLNEKWLPFLRRLH